MASIKSKNWICRAQIHKPIAIVKRCRRGFDADFFGLHEGLYQKMTLVQSHMCWSGGNTQANFEIKCLKIKHIVCRGMPCAFVSNGHVWCQCLTKPDFVWNNFANQEGFDSEKPSSFEEGDKTAVSVEKPTKCRMEEARRRILPNVVDYFKSIPREDEQRCVCDTVLL